MTELTGPHAPFDSRAYAVSRASSLPMDDPRVLAASRKPTMIDRWVYIVCDSHRQRAKIQHAMREVTGADARPYYTMRRGGRLLFVPPAMAEALRHGPGTSRWRKLAGESDPRPCMSV